MVELGELEKNWQEFEKQKVKVVVISLDDMEDTKATQEEFPHLVVVSDEERKLSEAIDIIHQRSGPNGIDSAAPTTLLIDGNGTVRWLFRPDRVFDRLSPAQLLAAIDEKLLAK
jgi:peroxiredoxin